MVKFLQICGFCSKLSIFRPLEIGKPDAWAFFGFGILERCQFRTLHRCADRAADQTVQPVIVGPRRPLLPLVNRSRERHCSDTVLGSKMFGKQAVFFGFVPEKG